MIQGYRAHLAPGALGLNFTALVFATMREGTSQAVNEFEAAVQKIPHVTEAQRLFTDPDYRPDAVRGKLGGESLKSHTKNSTWM